MACLQELTRGISVKGILPDGLVTVVDVKWHGSAVVELTYKDAAGRLGFEPRDVSAHKCGYDLESRVPGSGRLRFLEVKGRVAGTRTVTVTKNEILTGLNKPDDFILAIVVVDGDTAKKAWVEPVVDHTARRVRFEVRTGEGVPSEGTVNRRGTVCICCGTPVPFDHVLSEGKAGRMGAQLMAIVAEGQRGRVYLRPNEEHEATAAVWSQSRDQSVNVFSRQALPMNWDFPEVNPFAGAAGDFGETSESMSKSITMVPATNATFVFQKDASAKDTLIGKIVIATDPPYYDNIGYADLSDFFYVWLRSSLSKIYPDLFSTLLVPKTQELVATPYRFGGDKEKAQRFFEDGLSKAFVHMHEAQYPHYPVTIFYAFKQAEKDEDDNSNSGSVIASTGWETMLDGLVRTGFTITGTWPMRTERPTGVKVEVNALASSIVLVCRLRPADAPMTSRRDFLKALKHELPPALKNLRHGNIAPVDLAQAAIGPGMAVFSRYSKVLEADGLPMGVRTALALINQTLDEVLAEQEGEFDADTRWAVAWFEQFGFEEGPLREYPKPQYTWPGAQSADMGQRGEKVVDALLASRERGEKISRGRGYKRFTRAYRCYSDSQSSDHPGKSQRTSVETPSIANCTREIFLK